MAMEKFDKTVLSIIDDTGLLALVNADRYTSFVGSNWSLEQLQQRFTEQAEAKTILIWRTGGEGFHKVAILLESAKRDATIQFSGEIEVTSGCLYLTNYEDLSMAAQFEDETLLAAHNSDLLVSLPNALYNVTIHQLNYRDDAIGEEEEIDFEICLTAQS